MVVLCNFQSYGLGRVGWEGYRSDSSASSSASSSKKASFRVKEPSSHGLFGSKSTTCKVKYDDKRYSINPCRIEKSPDAKLEFQITNNDGKIIAEVFNPIFILVLFKFSF